MSLLSRLLLAFIRVYQCTFSAIMGKNCRYYPTCSVYTAGAIRRFGAFRGSWMGVKRICRCHPYSAGGHDPVPETER
jgi:putative membrane protein insertion efficiency factor